MGATALSGKEHRLFFRALSGAKQRVLIVDYDGTVAPFSADRSDARPYPEVQLLLRQIMTTCSTRLIVISGRSAREIPRLLAIYPFPEIWGSHGVERLYADGRYTEGNVSDDALQALAEAELRLERASLEAQTEVKLAAIAVHWRGLQPDDVYTIRARACRILEPMTSEADLVLSEFDEGVELRVRSANKGDAVRALLPKLNAGIPLAYLGDDFDDEDAFRALNGHGLTVLIKPKPRPTAAQIVLKPPDQLAGFFTDWIRACTGKS